MTKAATFLVVEDHPLFREGLCTLLEASGIGAHVAQAGSASQALELLRSNPDEIDVVLLDLGLPDAKPFELLASIRRLAPQVPVVVLSATEERLEIEHALRLGAQAYLFKSTQGQDLVAALKRVLKGEIVVPPVAGAAQRSGGPREASGLTDRQRAVLGLLASGVSNKEIAEQLEVSENTVKVHLMHIYRVLGVTTRTAAVRRAQRVGFLPES